MAIEKYTPDANAKIHETSVDFILRNCPKEVHIVQYDKTQPIVMVRLYKNGSKYVLPESALLNLRFSKPDNTFIYKSVLGCDDTRTIVYFDVDEQMTLLYGKVNPILELVIGDTIAGTSPIPVEIDRNPIQNGDIESKSDIPAIMESVGKATKTADEALKIANEAKQITENAATKQELASEIETVNSKIDETLQTAKDYTDAQIANIDYSVYAKLEGGNIFSGNQTFKNSITVKEKAIFESDLLANKINLPTINDYTFGESEQTFGKYLDNNYVKYIFNKVQVDETEKTIAKISPSSIFVPSGLIMGGSARQAGLMTRGISGSTEPDGSSGACSKDALYVNFDGVNTYARELVLGAGSRGSAITVSTAKSTVPSSLMGNAFSAIRGDQMVNYVTDYSANILQSAKDYTDAQIANIDYSVYAKLEGGNTFTGDQTFKNNIEVDGYIVQKSVKRDLGLRDNNFWTSETYFPIRIRKDTSNIDFGIKGNDDVIYDLEGFAKLNGDNTFSGKQIFTGTTRNVYISGDNFGSTTTYIPFEYTKEDGTIDGFGLVGGHEVYDLKGFAKLDGGNTFIGIQTFKGSAREVYIDGENFIAKEGFIPFKVNGLNSNNTFGIYGADGTIYDLQELKSKQDRIVDGTGSMRFGGSDTQTKYRLHRNGNTGNEWKYFLIGTMKSAGDVSSCNFTAIRGRIGGWAGTNSIYIDTQLFGRDGPVIIGTLYSPSTYNTNYVFTNISDIILSTQDDGTQRIYIAVKGYYDFDLNIEASGAGAEIVYDGNELTSISGDDAFKLSTSQYVTHSDATVQVDGTGSITFKGTNTQTKLRVHKRSDENNTSDRYILLCTLDLTTSGCSGVMIRGIIGDRQYMKAYINLYINAKTQQKVCGYMSSIPGLRTRYNTIFSFCKPLVSVSDVTNTMYIYLNVKKYYDFDLDILASGENSIITYSGEELDSFEGDDIDILNVNNSNIIMAENIATKTKVDAKQDKLVSGTNIKTINDESILGSGNIKVTTSASDIIEYIKTYVYPVGSIYLSCKSAETEANPANWLPNTDWTELPDGYYLQEYSSSAGGTAGRSNFTITSSNLPRHTHGVAAPSPAGNNWSGNANSPNNPNNSQWGLACLDQNKTNVTYVTNSANGTQLLDYWGYTSPTSISLNPNGYHVRAWRRTR